MRTFTSDLQQQHHRSKVLKHTPFLSACSAIKYSLMTAKYLESDQLQNTVTPVVTVFANNQPRKHKYDSTLTPCRHHSWNRST